MSARPWILAAVWAITVPSTADAVVYFVDNRIGNDGSNGLAPTPVDEVTGPVRTILRGLELCRRGDSLVLANNPGMPYFESLQLYGERHSGNFVKNFEIVGNGAVVNGLRRVPESAWRYVADDVWELRPYRKNRVLLLLDGTPVPRHRLPDSAPLAEIPVGHFATHRGNVFLRTDGVQRPPQMNFAFAYDDVGVTLYKVHDVTIRDVTFSNFRLDGVNAADSARRIRLEGVSTLGNGRSGITLRGISTVYAEGCTVLGNLEHSILVEDSAGIEVRDSTLDTEPTVTNPPFEDPPSAGGTSAAEE